MHLNVAASLDRQIAIVPTCVHGSVIYTDNISFNRSNMHAVVWHRGQTKYI